MAGDQGPPATEDPQQVQERPADLDPPRWGQAQLGSITHADVVAWVAEIQRDRSAGLTRHTLAILSQMLELAVRDGRLPRNVARGVRRPRLSRPVQRFLSQEEVARLARDTPPPYDVLVILLAFTGLRFGEAAGLTVGDVDLARSRISVNWSVTESGSGELHRDSPKTYRRRTVPIPAFLRDRLAVHIAGRAPDEPLFPSPKGGLLCNSNSRHTTFDPAVKRAGLVPLTPHNLRDTVARLAVASGAKRQIHPADARTRLRRDDPRRLLGAVRRRTRRHRSTNEQCGKRHSQTMMNASRSGHDLRRVVSNQGRMSPTTSAETSTGSSIGEVRRPAELSACLRLSNV